MPEYNIAGVKFFIPGIDDLTSFVVTPLTNTVNAVLNTLRSDVAALGNATVQVITSQVGAVIGDLTSLRTAFEVSATSLGSGLASGFTQFESLAIKDYQVYIAGPIQGYIHNLAGQVSFLGHEIRNVTEFTVHGLNQLATGLGQFGHDIFMGLHNLPALFWNQLQVLIVQPFTAAVNAAGAAVIGAINEVNRVLKSTLLSLLPRSPEAAFDSAFLVAEIGVATLIAGEVISLAIEAAYPTKHLGVVEAFHKGLEILGVTEVTAALYAIVVESGWKLNLQYYFNYQLQPRKISPDGAVRGVWYGTRDIEQLRIDLQYEGYNSDAIDTIVSTIYRPLPTFLLARLLDTGAISDDFAAQQLAREGFDPQQIPELVVALQNLKLVPFQDTARSLVYSQYRDGFVREPEARNILTAFNVPRNQQDWVIELATREFEAKQKSLIRDVLLDLFTKGQLSQKDTSDALFLLGMSRDRADLTLSVIAIKQKPPATKQEREKIFAEVFGS